MPSTETFDKGYNALVPVPADEQPLLLARLFYILRAVWDVIKDINPSDLNLDYEMTVEELHDFLPDKPATQTIYGWASDNLIPYIKRGKRLLFVRAAIVDWHRNGRPANPDNYKEIALSYVANHRPGNRRKK